MGIQERIEAPGPKRVLSLDGGGVRGVLSLAILARIEAILAARAASPDRFRLADYFDLVGGTSTGSIIATGLAWGFSCAEMLDIYRQFARRVFRRSFWGLGLFGPRFARGPLESLLREIVGDATLDSDRLTTGLAVVTKRADNGSVWVLHNNPRSPFFDAPPGDPRAFPNRRVPLVSAMLASTAAPTYFQPEFIKISTQELGAFIDGAVSPHNNPALQMLMLCGLKGYGYEWPLGPERLMLVSVGTGIFRRRFSETQLRRLLPPQLAINALQSMILDSNRLTQTLLQWFSSSPTARHIDREIGDLAGDRLPHGPLLHYLRYDAQLEIDWLAEHCGLAATRKEIERIQQIDNPSGIDFLIEVGRVIADRHVSEEHFPAAFDRRADGGGAAARHDDRGAPEPPVRS